MKHFAIDLGTNAPPFHLAEPYLRQALAELATDPELTALCGYAPNGGEQVARDAAAVWLRRTSALIDATGDQLLLCAGVMNALYLVMQHLHRAGDAVMCEAATFFGIREIARQLGLRLVPVAMDDQGMLPAALAEAARSSAARSLILIPTLQNPLGLTYPASRRYALAELSAELDLTIIEDDIYGGLVREEYPLPAFQTLAPERTFYVGGVSKVLMPGLRVGWLRCPERHHEAIRELMWATGSGAPHFGHRVFATLVASGRAMQLRDAVRNEVHARSEEVRRRLHGRLGEPAPSLSLHYWLPCTRKEATRVHLQCLQRGLTLTPPDLPRVDESAPTGLRLCIGGARSMQSLSHGLNILEEVLKEPAGKAT